MFVYKVDDGLYLKLVQPQDAKKLFKLTNESRDYLREWLPWLDSTRTVYDTKQFIKFSMKRFAENKAMSAAILYHDEIVGIAGYNEIDWSNRAAYIGYWLGQPYQGKGIMTKVVKGLTDYALKELHLNRVEIRAAVGNQKSRAIPERLGYVEEGRIRQAERLYDQYVDHIVYGMLAEDWK